MATGIDSYLSNYYNGNTYNPFSSGASSTSSLQGLDFSGMNISRDQAQKLVDSYTSGGSSGTGGTVQTLKTETSNFLDRYVSGIKQMDQSANAVRLDNLDKLLYDADGNVTEETIAATVKAVQTMADDYNSMMNVLNTNANRGPGVTKQLARMAANPAPVEGLEMVGVTINKDGTLAVDQDRMKAALATTDRNQLNLYKDIIGGWNGLADNIHKRAEFGNQMSAQSLISNDLASIQSSQNDNPFREMYLSTRGNAYALNNQAVVGMMMNMLV